MTELHTTHDADRFRPLPDKAGDPRYPEAAADCLSRGSLPLIEGKTFHHFNSLWGAKPRYTVPLDLLSDKKSILEPAEHYRFAFRKVASSTNERTIIAAMLPPGSVFADNTVSEMAPAERSSHQGLALIAIANTFCFDWFLRLKVAATVNIFMLRQGLVPELSSIAAFLSHMALRLTCNHAGYAALWVEQMGDAWSEPPPKHTWPVLENDSARWIARAAIDAVVADAFGLDRTQYEHVLSTFNHKSYPKAPEICLAAFDELKDIGLNAFTKKHDPYWDFPLNEALPKPVIDLPGLEREVDLAAEEKGESPEANDQESASDAGLTKLHVHPTDASAILLAYALAEHNQAGKDATLGSVKCEKLLHMAESYLEVDLGRAPMRLAAGPADVPHLKKVFHRAERRWSAFRAVPRQGRDGARLVPQLGLTSAAGRLDEAFGEYADKARELVRLFLLMDTERAEIVATLYACWNDLLARGEQPDDAAIIAEFHGWAEGKRRFDADRLAAALAWMRGHSLVPTGKATPTRWPVGKAEKKAKSRNARPQTDDSAYEAILARLNERGVISSQDAQQATGLDAAGVRPHLKRLVDEGLAVTEGERRGMKYRRVSHA